jgi:hypothetical protein
MLLISSSPVQYVHKPDGVHTMGPGQGTELEQRNMQIFVAGTSGLVRQTGALLPNSGQSASTLQLAAQ